MDEKIQIYISEEEEVSKNITDKSKSGIMTEDPQFFTNDDNQNRLSPSPEKKVKFKYHPLIETNLKEDDLESIDLPPTPTLEKYRSSPAPPDYTYQGRPKRDPQKSKMHKISSKKMILDLTLEEKKSIDMQIADDGIPLNRLDSQYIRKQKTKLDDSMISDTSQDPHTMDVERVFYLPQFKTEDQDRNMHNKELDPLLYGVPIRLWIDHQKSPPFYFHCEGTSSKRLEVHSQRGMHLEDELFRIIPPFHYTYWKKFSKYIRKLTESKSDNQFLKEDSEIDFHEVAAEIDYYNDETHRNYVEYMKLKGKPISYGSQVQIVHEKTNLFLCVDKTIEMQDNEDQSAPMKAYS